MTKQGLRNKNDTEVVHYGQTVPAYVCNSPCIKVCHFNKKPDEKQGKGSPFRVQGSGLSFFVDLDHRAAPTMAGMKPAAGLKQDTL